MVEWQLPKLLTRVRFPPGAPADQNTPESRNGRGFSLSFLPTTNALTLSFVLMMALDTALGYKIPANQNYFQKKEAICASFLIVLV